MKNQADEKAIIHKSRGLPEVVLNLGKIAGSPLYEDSVAVVEDGSDVEESLQPANNGVLVNTNEGISNECCFEMYGFKAKNSKISTADNYRARSRVSQNDGMHKTMHKPSETAENNCCGVDYKSGHNEADTTKSELVPRTNNEEAVCSGIHTEKEFMRSYTNNVAEERIEDPNCGTLGDHFLDKYGYKCSKTRRNALVSSNIGTVGDAPSTRVVDFEYANNNGGFLQVPREAVPHDTVTKEGGRKYNECHPFDNFRFKDIPLKRRAAVDIGKENCRGKVLRLCASYPDRREESNKEKKFGCDISHLKSYSDCAEKSMDRLVSLISSATFRGGARASGLRAPIGEPYR